MKNKSSLAGNRRAATAVEFALVVPTVILLLFGMIEIGWQAVTEMAFQNGASDAVRFAMTGQSEVPDTSGSPSCRAASIAWITIHVAPYILTASRLSISSSTNGGASVASNATGFGGAKSQTITYRFTYTQPYLTFLGPMITGNDALIHTVTMLVQNEPYPTSGC